LADKGEELCEGIDRATMGEFFKTHEVIGGARE
jgi:hypothetical protein